MIRWSLLVAILSTIVALAPTSLAAEPITVADDLRFPAGIAFDSGGTMYVTEREGRILAFEGAEPRVVASIPTITQGETGLLGIALSPDDREVYAFATEANQTNSVWRVSATGGEPERVITGLPGGTYHNGGGVAFGPDGNLYVTNGEKHDSELAQDPGVLGGKIYRYTPDGDVPDDNPFRGSPTWAMGLRNPFGIAIDPWTGNPFVTENGPESFDEINQIVSGGNYGWPVVSGPASDTEADTLGAGYHEPMLSYESIIVPTGITFADPFNAIPSMAGDMFFGTYGDQTIHRVVMDRQRTEVWEDITWFHSPEPIVALAWGPRGLYYSTPGAVKLIELARPDRTGDGVRDTDTSGWGQGRTALLLFGGAAVLLAAALLYAFGTKKRGRA